MKQSHLNDSSQAHRDYGFVCGLMTGTIVGAGLAMWFAPRVTGELRQRAVDSLEGLGQQASDRFQEVSTQVSDKVDELTRKGQEVRDEVADAVAKGAREVSRGAKDVERFANAAKSDRH